MLDPRCCFLEVGLNIDIIKDESFFFKQKCISVPVICLSQEVQ